MRIQLTDLIFRIVARYGALALFVTLLTAFLLVIRSTFKPAGRPAVSVGILVFLILGLALFGPAALRGGSRFIQFARAAFSVPPVVAGPFAAASATFELAPSTETERPDDRPILLHLWYPADPASAIPKGELSSCAELEAGMHLSQAPAAYPVVLFAPGLSGTPSDLSLITETLAKNGYVVAAIDDLDRDAPSLTASAADEDIRLRPFDFSSAGALSETMRRSSIRAQAEASKALEALNRLEACVQNAPALRGRLQFGRVAFVGYSFGGAAAAEASFMDARIVAVVNMDGSLFGRAAEGPVNVPYMMLHSDFDRQVLFDPDSPHRYEFMLDQRDLRLAAEQSLRPDSHLFIVRNSFHDTFADPTPNMRRLVKWLLLDPYRAHEITSAHLVGFLNAYLKDDRSTLVEAGDPRYPDVLTFNSHG